jgi:hypothetical protein
VYILALDGGGRAGPGHFNLMVRGHRIRDGSLREQNLMGGGCFKIQGGRGKARAGVCVYGQHCREEEDKPP